jgi:flagellar hook-length control protein FliK
VNLAPENNLASGLPHPGAKTTASSLVDAFSSGNGEATEIPFAEEADNEVRFEDILAQQQLAAIELTQQTPVPTTALSHRGNKTIAATELAPNDQNQQTPLHNAIAVASLLHPLPAQELHGLPTECLAAPEVPTLLTPVPEAANETSSLLFQDTAAAADQSINSALPKNENSNLGSEVISAFVERPAIDATVRTESAIDSGTLAVASQTVASNAQVAIQERALADNNSMPASQNMTLTTTPPKSLTEQKETNITGQLETLHADSDFALTELDSRQKDHVLQSVETELSSGTKSVTNDSTNLTQTLEASIDENSSTPSPHTALAASPSTTSPESINQFVPRSTDDIEVTKTVTDNLIQQVKLTEQGESKQLRLQLHPAELGQVTLQIDWENESLNVKLLTNEAAATEMLNQNKSELVTALAEEGIDFDSLEISYDHDSSDFDQGQSEGNTESQDISPAFFATPELNQSEVVRQHSTTSLDITI